MIPAPLPAPGRLRQVAVTVATPALRSSVGTSSGTHEQRRVAYVHIRTDDCEGVGEIAAMDMVVGDDPSLDAVLQSLESTWLPKLLLAAEARQGSCPGSHLIASLGATTGIDKMVVAAIEMAVLDLELRCADRSLASWLNVDVGGVPFGIVVGIPSDHSEDAVLDRAARGVEAGASRIRLKVARGFSASPARLVINALDVPVQVDANGAFGLDQRGDLDPELAALDAVGAVCIEQPVAGRDLTVMAAVKERLETALCLDETVRGVQQVRDIIRYRAADVLCLKPGRMGGMRPALGALELARDAGLRCFIGGMFETGLGRASLGVLSQHPAASLVSDVSAPATYLTEDPCELEPPDGRLQPLWSGAGVGPHPLGRHLQTIVQVAP